MTDPLAVPIPEAARICGVGRSKLYDEINKRNLRILKVGRRTLVTMEDLRAWLASKAKEAE
jgi:excisionase family DNA binding protein